jgi:AraC-like DNA-binding protein
MIDSKIPQPVERDAQLVQAQRDELVERIARAIHEDGTADPLDGIHLYRASSPTAPLPGVFEPAFCVIAQGSKELYLGEEYYRYDPYHYCLGTVELPIVSQIIEASKGRPYLSLGLKLDPILVGSIMVEAGHHPSENDADARAISVDSLDADLLDAVVRLVRLLDAPKEALFLAPLITREIVFRLLKGKHGNRLHHIAVVSGYTSPIARAIERFHKHFDEPLRIESIARELGLSVSWFHHHFKAITGMSPLQFQKRLRLQEARRLMLGDGLDAASAAYRVGYRNAAHFNREYKNLFGLPPMRDVERLRGTTRDNISLAV